MMALPLALASLLTKFTGISPKVSRIYSRITTVDYLKSYSLGNQPVENLIEYVLAEAITEVGKSTIGGSLEKIEATEETEPSVVAKAEASFLSELTSPR